MAVNIICVALKKDEVAEMSARAAIMAIINTIPLLCGQHLSFIPGMTRKVQMGLRRWTGRVIVALILVHTTISMISMIKSGSFQLTKLQVTGIVVRHLVFAAKSLLTYIGKFSSTTTSDLFS